MLFELHLTYGLARISSWHCSRTKPIPCTDGAKVTVPGHRKQTSCSCNVLSVKLWNKNVTLRGQNHRNQTLDTDKGSQTRGTYFRLIDLKISWVRVLIWVHVLFYWSSKEKMVQQLTPGVASFTPFVALWTVFSGREDPEFLNIELLLAFVSCFSGRILTFLWCDELSYDYNLTADRR